MEDDKVKEERSRQQQNKQIYIREEYVWLLKKTAASQERKMQDLANEAIEQYLEVNKIE